MLLIIKSSLEEKLSFKFFEDVPDGVKYVLKRTEESHNNTKVYYILI